MAGPRGEINCQRIGIPEKTLPIMGAKNDPMKVGPESIDWGKSDVPAGAFKRRESP
ncbi:hypothetical protein [Desulfospira joergensenii]|uniref:hypothetical protein n=1 Tax=Desulfospira joergensenii TaxID=53329 RepID=UPI0003B43E51|nr:hypothetical protein [Desulfospira joergensenii]